MDLYSARIHQLSGAQGALLPLLIRLTGLLKVQTKNCTGDEPSVIA